MKRLLLPLLAVLALSTAIYAESYNAGLAKLQYKKMIQLEENSGIFMLKGDREAACSQMADYDFLLLANFDGLQEAVEPPSNFKDWFEVRENSQRRLKSCEYWGY